MSRRVRIECQFEIELQDLPEQAARSLEELRDHGAQLRVVTESARAAVEAAPGVELLWWSDQISPTGDTS